MNAIRIRCTGADIMRLSDLVELQGNLKELSVKNYEKLKGLILRVRNSGREAQVLNENMLAARGAVAFMTPVSELAAGQETAVYLIQENGGR